MNKIIEIITRPNVFLMSYPQDPTLLQGIFYWFSVILTWWMLISLVIMSYYFLVYTYRVLFTNDH